MCGFGTDWIDAASESALPFEEVHAQSRDALIIFVKNPQLGKVKTRLAKTIGDAAAHAAYLQMLANVRAAALGVDCDRWVYYSDFVDADDEWQAADFLKAVQPSGDLGAKMAGAIDALLARGYARVALVGSDLLDLQPHHLVQAFKALEHYDFVLGPARDGGYYLIGMKASAPSLFQDKKWSTETVLASTLSDIRQLGKTVHLLTELSDVDTEADWVAAKQRWEMRQPK